MIARYQGITPLIAWARERESVRIKKAQGLPAPWTEDTIIQTYRFCNLRRRDDRVSQWLLKTVLRPTREWTDPITFLKWVALCRWVNWPPTLATIMLKVPGYQKGAWDQGTVEGIVEVIETLTKQEKAWTGAYMIRAPSKKRHPGLSKARFVVAEVVGEGLERGREGLLAALALRQCRTVSAALEALPNWGSFMAGQVTADLTYTNPLVKAEDLYTWAPVGPGSRRGYNRLLALPLKARAPDEATWCAQLQRWRWELIGALGPEYETLTLHDVQNALCEYDKYERARLGQGRPRSKYRPETAYNV